jgi:hypothetical protein
MMKDFEEAAEKYAAECYPHNPAFQPTVKAFFLAGCDFAITHAVPKWISVGERTPANNEWVWVCHPHRYGIKAMFVGQNKFGQMWRYDGDTMATFNKPSHWQPLPELPSPPSTEPLIQKHEAKPQDQ